MQHRLTVYSCAVFVMLGVGGVQGAAQPDKSFPKGSEKAVAGIRDAFPKAEIDSVVEPKGFGGSGGKGMPLFWSIQFHAGDAKHNFSVTPEGTIIRFPVTVAPKDLPAAVSEGVAKAVPGARIKSAVKNEMRATLKYVALEKPIVQQYGVEVIKDKKRSLLTMNASGANVMVTAVKEPAKPDSNQQPKKDIEIPAKAAKSVQAIKKVYPEAIVLAVTTEVFDDGSGDIGILTYEIEFLYKGKKREMVASPDGIIPHLWAPVDAKALPKTIVDAVDKAVPGAAIQRASAFETRAGLRFAALEQPKVYFTVTVEKDGKEQRLDIRPDGSPVKKAAFPKK